jgi:hypothetical protein
VQVIYLLKISNLPMIIRSTSLKWIGILQMSVVRARGRIVMMPQETALTPAQLPLWNLLIERHEFQGSRLFSPRAFLIGGVPWRMLSGGKNQPFARRVPNA